MVPAFFPNFTLICVFLNSVSSSSQLTCPISIPISQLCEFFLFFGIKNLPIPSFLPKKE